MATSYAILVYLLLHVTFSTTTTTTAAATTKPRRLVTRLLHRDSLLHNPNDTIAAQAERFLNSSISRFIFLSEKIYSETRPDDDIQPSLLLGSKAPLFYVTFFVGQPPVPQLAVMDTGSDLIWVNCNPVCKNCGPIFYPSRSSTFAKMPCNRTLCINCSPTDECNYNVRYVKGTNSEGIIATERFSFETLDEGRIVINDVVFGCGNNNGEFIDKSTGIFGLSISKRDIFSIVKLMGSRFSYCVGNIVDHEYKFNRLVLGGAVIEGYSTPIEIANGLYYLTLEGISIGEKRLEIDSEIFKRTSSNNGVFIDSGTTYTWLTPTAYQAVRREIEDLCKGLLMRLPYPWAPDGYLCYFGEVSRDVEGFPVITFHFAEGADLVLDVYGMILQVQAQVFCLAILPSEDRKSLIGMIAQQNYNVAYDLGISRLYLQRIDCELLGD
ncbi:hypothetical protein LWI28_025951 [Acer negundo]|uniref:Peptidase A1 domain-containing protein n=1 Tax=Acer negundo TaxID=4023 RepID=A0AAD5JH02_ACENE|nr:hypothetical protein LWI28_025951 [Acer negundo]